MTNVLCRPGKIWYPHDREGSNHVSAARSFDRRHPRGHGVRQRQPHRRIQRLCGGGDRPPGRLALCPGPLRGAAGEAAAVGPPPPLDLPGRGHRGLYHRLQQPRLRENQHDEHRRPGAIGADGGGPRHRPLRPVGNGEAPLSKELPHRAGLFPGGHQDDARPHGRRGGGGGGGLPRRGGIGGPLPHRQRPAGRADGAPAGLPHQPSGGAAHHGGAGPGLHLPGGRGAHRQRRRTAPGSTLGAFWGWRWCC